MDQIQQPGDTLIFGMSSKLKPIIIVILRFVMKTESGPSCRLRNRRGPDLISFAYSYGGSDGRQGT